MAGRSSAGKAVLAREKSLCKEGFLARRRFVGYSSGVNSKQG